MQGGFFHSICSLLYCNTDRLGLNNAFQNKYHMDTAQLRSVLGYSSRKVLTKTLKPRLSFYYILSYDSLPQYRTACKEMSLLFLVLNAASHSSYLMSVCKNISMTGQANLHLTCFAVTQIIRGLFWFFFFLVNALRGITSFLNALVLSL